MVPPRVTMPVTGFATSCTTGNRFSNAAISHVPTGNTENAATVNMVRLTIQRPARFHRVHSNNAPKHNNAGRMKPKSVRKIKILESANIAMLIRGAEPKRNRDRSCLSLMNIRS